MGTFSWQIGQTQLSNHLLSCNGLASLRLRSTSDGKSFFSTICRAWKLANFFSVRELELEGCPGVILCRLSTLDGMALRVVVSCRSQETTVVGTTGPWFASWFAGRKLIFGFGCGLSGVCGHQPKTEFSVYFGALCAQKVWLGCFDSGSYGRKGYKTGTGL